MIVGLLALVVKREFLSAVAAQACEVALGAAQVLGDSQCGVLSKHSLRLSSNLDMMFVLESRSLRAPPRCVFSRTSISSALSKISLHFCTDCCVSNCCASVSVAQSEILQIVCVLNVNFPFSRSQSRDFL